MTESDDRQPSHWLERFFLAHPEGEQAEFDRWVVEQARISEDEVLQSEVRALLAAWLIAVGTLKSESTGRGAVRRRRADEYGSEGDSDVAWSPSRAPGDQVAHFTLLRFIASGGMGQVWEARDEILRSNVALKLIAPGRLSERSIKLFLREARAGGRLNHPNVVRTLASGSEEGTAWIAQELVPGSWTLKNELDQLRARDGLAKDHYRRVAELVARVADGLQAAHEAGVIHRDVKPLNILIAEHGRPKLADFGLARVSDDSYRSQSGVLAGTWAYLSPEQITAEKGELDERSDVFSLGVVLYELLALRRPFDGDTAHQIVSQIVLRDPPHPSSIRSQCPRELGYIAAKALEKSPSRRYGSMREFAADIRRHLSNRPTMAKSPSRAQRALKWVRRNKARAITTASIAAASIAAASFLTYYATIQPVLAMGQSAQLRTEYERRLVDSYLYLSDGDRQRALREFEGTLPFDPDPEEALVGIVLALGLGSDVEEIEAYREEHQSLFSRYSILQHASAASLRSQGQDQAATLLEATLPELSPDLQYFSEGMRSLLLAEGGHSPGFEAASGKFLAAIMLSPQPVSIHYHSLVHAAGHSNDEDLVREAAKAIESFWPDQAAGKYWVGYSLILVGRSEEAIPLLEEAIRLRPGFRIASARLARALVETEDFHGAREVIQELIRSGSENPSSIDASIGAMSGSDGSIHGLLETVDSAISRKIVRREGLPGLVEHWSKAVEQMPDYVLAHAQLAATLFDMGEADRAEEHLSIALSLDPEHSRVLYALGKKGSLERDYGAALAAYEAALDADENLLSARIAIPATLLSLGTDLDRAEQLLKDLLSSGDGADSPYLFGARFNLGVVLWKQGKLREALEQFGESIVLNPDYFASHLYTGSVLHELENYEEARLAFTRAVELAPNHSLVRSSFGDHCTDLMKWECALEQYGYALEHTSLSKLQRADLHRKLGRLFEHGGDEAESRKHRRSAVELAPSWFELQMEMGIALGRSGDHAGALLAFEQAIENRGGSFVAVLNLAVALWAEGRDGEAVTRLDSFETDANRDLGLLTLYGLAIADEPLYYASILQCGSLLLENDEFAAAQWHLETARRDSPDSAVACNFHGRLLERRGDLLGARDAYLEALSKPSLTDEWSVDTRIRLGRVLEEQGEWEAALDHYREAVDLDPESPGPWNALGRASLRIEDLPTAIEALERASSIHSGSLTTELHLATARWKAGDSNGALWGLDEFSQTFGTSPVVESLIEQIVDSRNPP